MSFSVTILGSNSAIPTPERFPTAQVLNVHERFFLIDCGEGTQIRLRQFGINSSRINRIFISHLHGDHVFGLFGLISTFTLLGRKTDLHIHAHADLEATLDHYKKYFGTGLCYNIIYHPFVTVQPAEIYNDKQITVEIIPLRHSVPVAGFIFREKPRLLNVKKESIKNYSLSIKDIRNIKEGKDLLLETGDIVPNSELTLPPFKQRSYAFCTDTLMFTKLSALLRDIDLLYFESTFCNVDKKLAKITGHSTAAQAAKLALEIKAGRLLMGHFSTRYKSISVFQDEAREIFAESYAVKDGEKYEIPQVRLNLPA
jgi:ribonuclease Z